MKYAYIVLKKNRLLSAEQPKYEGKSMVKFGNETGVGSLSCLAFLSLHVFLISFKCISPRQRTVPCLISIVSFWDNGLFRGFVSLLYQNTVFKPLFALVSFIALFTNNKINRNILL